MLAHMGMTIKVSFNYKKLSYEKKNPPMLLEGIFLQLTKELTLASL